MSDRTPSSPLHTLDERDGQIWARRTQRATLIAEDDDLRGYARATYYELERLLATAIGKDVGLPADALAPRLTVVGGRRELYMTHEAHVTEDLLPLLDRVLDAPVDTDRWQIQTESGDYIWDIRLLKLSGDTLLFKQADTIGRARVDQIRELRLIRKTVVRGGADGAMQTAALTGSNDEIFDFGPLDFAARLRAIQQVFLVHPPSP